MYLYMGELCIYIWVVFFILLNTVTGDLLALSTIVSQIGRKYHIKNIWDIIKEMELPSQEINNFAIDRKASVLEEDASGVEELAVNITVDQLTKLIPYEDLKIKGCGVLLKKFQEDTLSKINNLVETVTFNSLANKRTKMRKVMIC